MNEVYKIKSVNKHVNQINKWREHDGAWVYQVVGSTGDVLAEFRFRTGKDFSNRLTNSDLLEIVRDRLEALNRSQSASFRSTACLQHVVESIMWADAPSFICDLSGNETYKEGE